MNCLIIGVNNKIVVNYLNYFVDKTTDNYFCIDNQIPNELVMNNKTKIYNNEINIKNIKSILKENKIDKVINFFEVNEKNLSENHYTKYNYDFVVDLYRLCVECKVNHFVYTTTTEVYGNSNLIKQEYDSLKPSNDYITSKINSDLFLQSVNEINITILRIAEVFGEFHKDSYLDTIILKVLNSFSFTVEEESDFYRSYIDVFDCNFLINKVLTDNLYGIYNVGTNTYLSAKKIIENIIKLADYKNKINFSGSRNVELSFVKPDCSKILNACMFNADNQQEKLNYYLRKVLHVKRVNNT